MENNKKLCCHRHAARLDVSVSAVSFNSKILRGFRFTNAYKIDSVTVLFSSAYPPTDKNDVINVVDGLNLLTTLDTTPVIDPKARYLSKIVIFLPS